MSETLMRTYELGYIIVPTVTEGDVSTSVETLKGAVATIGGEVRAEGTPEFIDLAYRIEKHVGAKNMKWDQGYFGWIKFDADPSTLEALKKALDGNLDLARYMIIKTNIENTIIFKKPKVDAIRGGFEQDEISDDEDETLDEPVDDMKEDHEKLPDVLGDIEPVVAPSETQEA